MENNNKNIDILQKEERILKEEKEILQEIKKEEKTLKKLLKNTRLIFGFIAFLVVGGIAGFIYYNINQSRVYIDKSQVSASIINLASEHAGILEEVFFNEGDKVGPNVPVTRVGNELVKTKIGGVITFVSNGIGKLFNVGETVASMINPDDLRVVGQIEENKGLKDISVGQQVIFTVDAFGSKQFKGVVDEISPTSRESDIVFNISDKRETKEFNIKVRFNIAEYPELKNGMSAKMWIYK